jgi:hypothetical protein
LLHPTEHTEQLPSEVLLLKVLPLELALEQLVITPARRTRAPKSCGTRERQGLLTTFFHLGRESGGASKAFVRSRESLGHLCCPPKGPPEREQAKVGAAPSNANSVPFRRIRLPSPKPPKSRLLRPPLQTWGRNPVFID